MAKQECSICGEEYRGFGNNADPINNGRCCEGCNATKVIPARIKESLKTNDNTKPQNSNTDGQTNAGRRQKLWISG